MSDEGSSTSPLQQPIEEPYPEGGRGWVVCAAAFFAMFTVFGIHISYGVIYANLVDEHGFGEAESAWIGSVAGSLNFLCGPVASFLCDRYGCRSVAFIGGILSVLGLFLTSFVQNPGKMYVTYGLLWGVGSGLSFTPSIIVLGQYFRKRFPLANGIASSGSGIGGLLAAPFIQFLLSNFGWQNSMRILACIANILWIGALLYGQPKTSHGGPTNTTDGGQRPLFTIWRSKPFVLLVVAVGMFQLCYPVPYMHLVKFTEDIGIPSSKGAWLLGILSITTTVSKILFGKISECACVNRRLLLQTAMFAMGLGTSLCPLATGYAGVLSYAIVYGMFDGCFVGQVPVVTADVVGHARLSQAVGNMFGAIALPMSFGPPIAGWLYHGFGSYNGAFHMAGGIAIFTSLLLFLIPYMAAKQKAFDVTDDVMHDIMGPLSHDAERYGTDGLIAMSCARSSKSGSYAVWYAMSVRRQSYTEAVRLSSDEERLTVVQTETVL
ncbi:predicted protein [Nematostella vectensis]|uniref:Major facilitator superfamily (MFS) profile domain-containing protein n=1 Tax=Nematostella vectensis TaxID=45351 RepID=A7RPD0_NEMVE|nr:predicted protein [Nematostella vectensis]|eukprot:XP_001638729.1 predicted protein [Nematostella vectensis]